LLADLSQPNPPRRAERSVIAKIASASGDGTIDIRTGKPRVDTDTLDSPPKSAFQDGPERIHRRSITLPGQRIVVKIAFYGHCNSCQMGDVGQNGRSVARSLKIGANSHFAPGGHLHAPFTG
jgi:hypothetical protein